MIHSRAVYKKTVINPKAKYSAISVVNILCEPRVSLHNAHSHPRKKLQCVLDLHWQHTILAPNDRSPANYQVKSSRSYRQTCHTPMSEIQCATWGHRLH